jgi:hypothetical protein
MHELLRSHTQRDLTGLRDVSQNGIPGQQGAYPPEIPVPSPSHVMSDPGPMPTLLGTADPSEYQFRGPRYPSTHRDTSFCHHLQPTEIDAVRPVKQRRSGFDIREEPISDFITKGLMTTVQAMSCFQTYVLLVKLRIRGYANSSKVLPRLCT